MNLRMKGCRIEERDGDGDWDERDHDGIISRLLFV